VCFACAPVHAQSLPLEKAIASAPVTVPAAPAIAPGVSLTPEMQGDLLMARGKYVAALAAYQSAPVTSAAMWNKIGLAYHHLYALDEAAKAYRKALAINPRYPAALNNLAAAYHGKHEYKQAVRTYKLALKYQPNVAVTYSNMGTAYFADLNYKQGMKAYQMAFRLDPNVFSPDQRKTVMETSSRPQLMAAHYYLARTYAGAGKQDQAIEYLRRAFGEGFNDRKRLEADKEFNPIRSTPEFQKLLEQQHPD
jgi:tetratricopeptide (TPR) repeat protein